MHPENIYRNGLDLDEIYKKWPEARFYLMLDENGRARKLNLPDQDAFFTKFLLQRSAFRAFYEKIWRTYSKY